MKKLLIPVLVLFSLVVGMIVGNLLPEWREMFHIYPDYGTVHPYDMTIIEVHSDGTGIDYQTDFDAVLLTKLTAQAYENPDAIKASVIVDGFGQVISVIVNGKSVSTTPAGWITREDLNAEVIHLSGLNN